jgi:hypothetical protein
MPACAPPTVVYPDPERRRYRSTRPRCPRSGHRIHPGSGVNSQPVPFRAGRPQSALPGSAEPAGLPRTDHRDPQLWMETGPPGIHDLLRRPNPTPMKTATITYTEDRRELPDHNPLGNNVSAHKLRPAIYSWRSAQPGSARRQPARRRACLWSREKSWYPCRGPAGKGARWLRGTVRHSGTNGAARCPVRWLHGAGSGSAGRRTGRARG